MKNLLIYINPKDKQFSREHSDLTKIQIDNSLDLGWHPSDLILVTNFDYAYRGINSIVVDDYTAFDADRSTKIPAINELFARDLIQDDVYWFHDHDAFQLVPFEIKLDKDAGFTDHGFSKKWNAGSFFFTKHAKNIFQQVYEYMNLRNTNEQDALTYMWQNDINGINNRYKLMNIAFNVGIYHHDILFPMMDRPLQVAHFHPHKKRHMALFRAFLPDPLVSIFSKYNI